MCSNVGESLQMNHLRPILDLSPCENSKVCALTKLFKDSNNSRIKPRFIGSGCDRTECAINVKNHAKRSLSKHGSCFQREHVYVLLIVGLFSASGTIFLSCLSAYTERRIS